MPHYLMYYYKEDGTRAYTLKKTDPNNKTTFAAQPARFSPDDVYSQHRIQMKEALNIRPGGYQKWIPNHTEQVKLE